jgi:ComF family protein
MKLLELKKRFFTLRKCMGCGKILENDEKERLFCGDCRLVWNVAKTESCNDCFQSAVECTCQPKEMANSGALCLRKLVFYKKDRAAFPILRTVYHLKNKPHKRTEEFFAAELSRAVSEEIKTLEISNSSDDVLITYVPRSTHSKRKYGIDQSERVVRALSENTGIECVELIKRKRIFGKVQKKLSRSERFANTKKQFELCSDAEKIKGKYIFLYDDVVTTGASMTACVKLLRKNGALGIICLCIARNQGKQKKKT